MRFIWLRLITRTTPLIRRRQWWPYIGAAATLLLIAHLSLAWWMQINSSLNNPVATNIQLELRQEVRAQDAQILLQNLQQLPYVQMITYRTKAQLLAEAQQRNPAMSSIYTARDNPFRHTLVVTIANQDIKKLIEHLGASYSDMQVLPTFLPDAQAKSQQANLLGQAWQGTKTVFGWQTVAAYLGVLFITLIFMRTRILARREELTLSYLAGAEPGVLMGSFWFDGLKLLSYALLISLILLFIGALSQGGSVAKVIIFPSFTAAFGLWWIPLVTSAGIILVMPLVVTWLALKAIKPVAQQT